MAHPQRLHAGPSSCCRQCAFLACLLNLCSPPAGIGETQNSVSEQCPPGCGRIRNSATESRAQRLKPALGVSRGDFRHFGTHRCLTSAQSHSVALGQVGPPGGGGAEFLVPERSTQECKSGDDLRRVHRAVARFHDPLCPHGRVLVGVDWLPEGGAKMQGTPCAVCALEPGLGVGRCQRSSRSRCATS